MKKLKRILILFIMFLILICLYSLYIEPKWIRVKKHTVTLDNPNGQAIKIVQFSDTQLGEFFSTKQLEEVVDKINKTSPDIVVFTGDLIDNASNYTDIDKVSKILSKIKAPNGKYAIYGNHDYGGGAVRYYNSIMTDAGFKVLKNSSTALKIGSINLKIFGTDDRLMGGYDMNSTIKGISSDDINLLLIHEPDLIDDFKDYPIDLAFAGHSHGGQVRIPIYGPLKKVILAEKYTHGLYTLENKRKTKLYVNTGLGNTRLPFRFGNIPEITVFTIEK